MEHGIMTFTRQIAAAIALLAAVGSAEETLPSRMLDAATVNLQIQNGSLRDVLETLASSAGVTVRFAPGVHAESPVNIHMTEASLADVFTVLLKAGDLVATSVDDDTVLISPAQR